MTKARDLANASTALSAVSATELGYVDGVTSAIQTQLDNKVDETGGSTITVASGTTVPLTIQNNGTGNSFVVNDVASDTTPFLIDSGGAVGIGVVPSYPLQVASPGTSTTAGGNIVARFQTNGSGYDSTIVLSDNVANSSSISMLGGATIFRQNGVEASRITAAATTTINAVTDGTTATATSGAGYMGMPQNSTTTGAYTLVAADAGKHIYSTATRTITIPANGTTAFPIGTTIVFINAAAVTLTVSITTDTLILAKDGTTGSRTLAAYGMATLVKITSTSWMISGNGLT